jgi:osmoprotectant transport system ATP-binding protein
VRQLVGADDIVRQLSLLRAEQVMRPLNGSVPDSLTVTLDQSLREALSIFLTSHHDNLTVVDAADSPVGILSMDDIRGAIE